MEGTGLGHSCVYQPGACVIALKGTDLFQKPYDIFGRIIYVLSFWEGDEEININPLPVHQEQGWAEGVISLA